MKREKMKREKMKKEMTKLIKFSLGAVCLFCLMGLSVNAGGLGETKLVTGFQNLLTDGAKVLVVLETGVLTFLEIKEGIAYQGSEEHEKAKHKKNMIGMAGFGVLIISITALVPVVFGYFQ